MADISEDALRVIDERYGRMKNLVVMNGKITAIPFKENTFDLAFCMRLFHHMNNDQLRSDALKELARVSKKYVAFSFYNKNCFNYYYRKIMRKKIRGNYISYSHMYKLAAQQGLEPVERYFLKKQCLAIFKKQGD